MGEINFGLGNGYVSDRVASKTVLAVRKYRTIFIRVKDRETKEWRHWFVTADRGDIESNESVRRAVWNALREAGLLDNDGRLIRGNGV